MCTATAMDDTAEKQISVTQADEVLDRLETDDDSALQTADEEEASSENADALVDTEEELAPPIRKPARIVVPKHVAIAPTQLSPVTPSSGRKSRTLSKRVSSVTFPGEQAFSVSATDSEASDGIETVSDALGTQVTAEDGDVSAEMAIELTTHAVELSIETKGFTHSPYRFSRALFVALFAPGIEQGKYRELGRTEAVVNPRGYHRWVKKLLLPAATTPDRLEVLALCVFEDGATAAATRTPVKGPKGALATCRISVAEILNAKQQSLDLELASPRSGRVRGIARLAVDLVPHVAFDERLHFDVAFAPDAPARNRIVFVISRAIPKGRWTPVYRSEIRTRDDLANFDAVVLTKRQLNCGNDRKLMRIEFYRFYKNLTTHLLGFCQTSLLSLRTCPLSAGVYWWPAQDGIEGAKMMLSSRTESEESSSYSLRVVPTSFKTIGGNSKA